MIVTSKVKKKFPFQSVCHNCLHCMHRISFGILSRQDKLRYSKTYINKFAKNRFSDENNLCRENISLNLINS